MFFCADLPMSEGIASLTCTDPSATIDEIQFAAYGLPSGQCGKYVRSTKCDAKTASDYVVQKCLGKSNCTINVSTRLFGDPCIDVEKRFVVQATCTGPNGGTGFPPENLPPLIQAAIDGDSGVKKTLIVNVKNKPTCISLPGSAGSTIFSVDESTGDGPARKDVLFSDKFVLGPFAVSVLYNAQ